MKQLKIFIDLTRLNKPIGFMLLFWPCSWGLAYAFDYSKDLNIFFYYLILFFLGSVLMRSAGCIINDIVDRNFDKKVKRIIFEENKKAQAIMTDKMDDLHKLAKALMDYETLTFDEISNILYNNTYPTRQSDKPDENEDKGKKESALGSIGLKPKLT